MALDTKQKRQSVIHPGSPWRWSVPFPDGTVAQEDRQTFLLLTNAILALAVQTGAYAFTGDLTTVFVQYLDALHDVALVASDSDTLVAKDVANMVAATTDTHDRNTRYFEYLH